MHREFNEGNLRSVHADSTEAAVAKVLHHFVALRAQVAGRDFVENSVVVNVEIVKRRDDA